MTKKKEGGRSKGSRGSRFSLRNILASTNLLTGTSTTTLPIPTPAARAEAFAGRSRRQASESESQDYIREGSELSEVVAIDCYIEPQMLETGLYECPLCLNGVDRFPDVVSCSAHKACVECWKMYLKIQITESRVNLTCFQCSKSLHPNDIKSLAEPDLMAKYEDFMLRRVMALQEPDCRWCPAPDCGFAVIATGCASCPRLLCERPGCNTAFCYHCKQLWHNNLTCHDAARLRSPDNMEALLSATGLTKLISENQAGVREEIKPCPRCQVLIVKMDDGSCNHMSCAVCGSEFCWLCMKQVSDLHYLSPSGCTFWGKKPWSRKKKLMWQLGTLIGAPVGIGLIAGVAVPALLIGVPVWVGRKIHSKMKTSVRHKRNLAVTGGVVAAVVISPLLAGLAVGLGVPILLAYVYGVVPISLCRSGGCGMSSSSSGVRIDVDEDDESIEPSAIFSGYASRSRNGGGDGGSNRGAPSIGEVSVNMKSADGDGESANASILSSSHPPSHNKLEIQADVITNHKRHSLSSSETASVSLSMPDDGGASTKGLAGSVLSYKVTIEDSKSETSCQ